MNNSNQILSDLTIHMKYARYDRDKNRRETWDEIVDRNKSMHLRNYPKLADYIERVYEGFVRPKKVLPSMRSLQFAGYPIERNPSRIYNCAYLPIDSIDAFGELMFLLLGGTGVGYSVQERHIRNLPHKKTRLEPAIRHKIGDSIEGWADAIKVLMRSFLEVNQNKVKFDYSDIREKGTELVVTGGRAPGAKPLREAIEKIERILEKPNKRLSSLDVHDICCHIADAVLTGGIRRAAMISLFTHTDEAMLTCKSGNWWEDNAQRARANNSAIIKRGSISKKEFDDLWKKVELSGAGEPGIYWTNDLDWGTNPCCEIALQPYQFCNLTEVNVSDVKDNADFFQRVEAATILGTMQAGYTDFHYLRPIWRKTTEKAALLGVGLTGIGSGAVLNLDIKFAAELAKTTNQLIADIIGINHAHRVTTIKPAGTSSLVLGCSSGIHAWHNDYYIRRIRVNKDEAIYHYLKKNLPRLVEDDKFNPDIQAVISIPQMAPEGSILRTESPEDLFARVLAFNRDWVRTGHVEGLNANNVSTTISLKPDEWKRIGKLMWLHRDEYNGLSVLPFDGGSYVQAPFEDITKEQYEAMEHLLHEIDLSRVTEFSDNTDLSSEAACAGGVCEIF